jgi:hypothetical protein
MSTCSGRGELRARQAGAGEVGEGTGEILLGQALGHDAAGGDSPGGGGGRPAAWGRPVEFLFYFYKWFFLVDIQIIYFFISFKRNLEFFIRLTWGPLSTSSYEFLFCHISVYMWALHVYFCVNSGSIRNQCTLLAIS